MTSLEMIQKDLDYIDEHIAEAIKPSDLADLSGYSVYHYYRVFNQYLGMPIKNYILKRKMQFALYDLSFDIKVIDVAVKYGFETHAGFTKAFKKQFGYSPNFYRIHVPANKPQRICLKTLNAHETGGIVLQPKIANVEAFDVVGYAFDTALEGNVHTKDIPAFWDKCNIEGKEKHLYETQPNPRHGEFGICIKKSEDLEHFSYLLGIEVSYKTKIEADMTAIRVEEGKYAIFSTPPVGQEDFAKSIQGTWRYILEEWFPNSGYEIDHFRYDFEFYDERCHYWISEKLMMEIYIPIKKNID